MTSGTEPQYQADLNIVRVIHRAGSDVEEVTRHVEQLVQAIDDFGCGRVMIIFTGNPAHQSRANRKRIADAMKRAKMERLAYVTANPMLRMVARAIMLTTKTAYPIRFFKDEEQAVTWLGEAVA